MFLKASIIPGTSFHILTVMYIYVIVRYEKESKNSHAVMFTSKDMENRNIIQGTMMSKQPVAVTDIGF